MDPIDWVCNSPTIRTLQPSGQLGFNNLPTQYMNKAMRKGFAFNVMCVGETGLGKSTLMDALFEANFESMPNDHHHSKVEILSHTHILHEENVKLKLTICDTVGYGDQIDKTDSYKSIMEYIDAQHELYLQEEFKLQNRNLAGMHDSRIHACLYFINPTGHSLKPLDIVCMKELGKRVNIIPVIAKSDTVTKSDLMKFKSRILDELREADIYIYQFSRDEEQQGNAIVVDRDYGDGDDDNDERNAVGVSSSSSKLNLCKYLPFAVIGSTDLVTVNGKRVRGREYPWGIVDIENEEHCDFVKLRELLIRHNMEDLREKTDLKFYELYRQERLLSLGFNKACGEGAELISYKNFLQQQQKDLTAEHVLKEDEMRQHFLELVKAQDIEIQEKEKELCERIQRHKEQHSNAVRDLEKAHSIFDDEYTEFKIYKEQYMAFQQTPLRTRSTNSVHSSHSARSALNSRRMKK